MHRVHADGHIDVIHAVALTASAEQLHELVLALAAKGVPHRPIHEPDPPFNGELVALGVRPTDRPEIKKFFKHLKLYKG